MTLEHIFKTGVTERVVPAGQVVWTPATLSGLRLLLDAAQLELPDGHSVETFTDLSGNGLHLTQPTFRLRPIVQSGVLRGLQTAIATPVDPAHAVVIDLNGDGIKDIVYCHNPGTKTVSWHRQAPVGTWTPFDIATGHVEIECLNAYDLDGDGKIEVIFGDQQTGIIYIAKQDTADPTGTWTTTQLLAGRRGTQWSAVTDLDGDGNVDFLYCWEGATGTGGVNVLRYLGGDPTNPASWSDHQLSSHRGAWWGVIMSNGDVAFTARRGADQPGIYYLTKPGGDVFTVWAKSTVFAGASDWTHIDRGNQFGDGHSDDLVVHDKNGIAPDDETKPKYGPSKFRKNEAWARTALPNPAPDVRGYNIRALPLRGQVGTDAAGILDVLYSVEHRDSVFAGQTFVYYSAEGAAHSLFMNDTAHPVDSEIHWTDIDNDGAMELVIPDSGGNAIWQVELLPAPPQPRLLLSGRYMQSGPLNLAQPFTIVAVGRRARMGPGPGPGVDSTLFDGQANTARYSESQGGSRGINFGNGLNAAGSNSDPHVYTVVTGAAADKLFVDGVEVISANAGPNALDALTLGARAALTNAWQGDVYELLVFDRALTEQERKNVEGYLGAKHSIAVPSIAPPSSQLQVLGEYDDDHTFTGGSIAAGGVISPAEFAAYPDIYTGGTTWLVRDTETGEYVFGGDLNDPEQSGGVVRISAVGWGSLSEETVIRLLLRSDAADQWQGGEEFGYADGADQISAAVEGETLLFTVSPRTEFKRGKAGNPADWKTGLYTWFPETDLRRIKFTVKKKKGDGAYTLQLVGSAGPGVGLTIIDSWKLGGNADQEIDRVIPAGYRLLGLRLRRTSPKKKAKGRRFRIAGLKVWGPITQADTYSVEQLIKYLFGLLAPESFNVAASATDAMPFDELDSSVGDLLDEATSWESWYWTVYPVEATGGKHAKAGPLGDRTWNVTDPHTPIRFIPARRYNKVSFQFVHSGRTRTKVVTANPDPFPGESRIYRLDAGEPAGEAVMTAFAQAVANFVATNRRTGSGTLHTVEDPTNPGVAVPASRVRPGHTIVDTNQGNKSGIVSRKKHHPSGKLVEIQLADGDEMLRRMINRRKMLLGQGHSPGAATGGALGVAEPEAPQNVRLRFNQVEKKNGRRRWNIRVLWDPVEFDIDGNGASVKHYVVWIRPRRKGGNVVPPDEGGGWRKQRVKSHDDGDPNDGNDDCYAVYKNVEQAKRWKWEVKVKAVDIYENESAWSVLGRPDGSHHDGGPPILGPGALSHVKLDLQKSSNTLQVEWDAPEEADSEGDTAMDAAATYYKITVWKKEKGKGGQWGNWQLWRRARSRSNQKSFHVHNTDGKRFKARVVAVDADRTVGPAREAEEGEQSTPEEPPPPPWTTVPETPAQPPEIHRATGPLRAIVTWRYNPARWAEMGVTTFVIELFRVNDQGQELFVVQKWVSTGPDRVNEQKTVEFGSVHVNPNKRYKARYLAASPRGTSGWSPWSGTKLF